jgi:hypothetical protein
VQRVRTARPAPLALQAEPVRAGDYLCSDRDLFRVERVLDDRALIEDCRTEVLIDVSLDQLATLERVEPDRAATA